MAPANSFEAGAYAAVRILAKVLAANPEASFADLPAIFETARFETPFGSIAIDARTQHATLPVEIGRVRDGGFEIVTREEAVAPTPICHATTATRRSDGPG